MMTQPAEPQESGPNENVASPYTPWKEEQQLGIAALAGGLLIIVMGLKSVLWLSLIGVPLAVFGLYKLKHVAARQFGKRLESKAIKGLRVPRGWTIEAGRIVEGLGDIDLLVTSRNGQKFAIEIKSYKGVQLIQAGFFRKNEALRHISGRKLDPDPLAQTLRNAEYLHAIPIIWLPQAVTPSRKKFKRSGVVVVQGKAKLLRRAMGIGWFG